MTLLRYSFIKDLQYCDSFKSRLRTKDTMKVSLSVDSKSKEKQVRPWNSILIILILVMAVPFLLSRYITQVQSQSWQAKGVSLPKSLLDKGVFNDLNPQAKVNVPTWLDPKLLSMKTWGSASKNTDNQAITLAGLFYMDSLLAVFPVVDGKLKQSDHALLKERSADLDLAHSTTLSKQYHQKYDRDHDGIFDHLDIHLGAVKTALNGADYQEGYERLAYPMGDVSRKIGVCTDVLVRAFRNAGWDLQEIMYKDMKARPRAYYLQGKKPNRHIDHRRVRRLIVYFKKYYKALPITFDPKQSGDQAWLPGDLIFMDTLNKGRPTHVGLVSGTLSSDGEPLIINNWTYGYKTSAMSLKHAADYMYRFRLSLKK